MKIQIRALARLLRPKHWVKNLFVVAPLAFSGRFSEADSNWRTLGALVVFCIAASATYVMNDIFDVAADRAHPTKRYSRPIAAGQVSVPVAWVVFVLLLFAVAGVVAIMPRLAPIIGGYLLLQVAYNLYLKRQPIIDLFVIAIGFVLRIYAGAFSIEVPVSKWMFVTTLSLAIFLASMKRLQELKSHGDKARKVLSEYTEVFTQRITEISGTLAVVFYSFYTFTAHPAFIYTIPVVLFVLIRYWFVADRAGAGESPTDLILRDWQLLAAAFVMICIVAFALLAKPHG